MRNIGQEEIIKNAKLPALVIAGPGTGKTHTIVNFVAEAIKNERFKANKILITTFTKKAAHELNTRIITRLKEEGLRVDLKDMMIGNFHSLAMDFITKYRRLDHNFFNLKIIDSFMEEFIVRENLNLFTGLDNFESFIKKDEVASILNIFQTIINQVLDLDKLKNSENPKDRLSYEIYLTYENLLNKLGLINFQLILKRFLDLLKDPLIGEKIRKSIDLVIIDEYQDTNLIQEEIAFALTDSNNIIVFGDDDQALYSFRGADAKNLTHFDEKFYQRRKVKVEKYFLDINYRSNQVIIDKARKFMEEAKGASRKELRSVDEKENPNTIVRARADEIDNLVKIVKLLSKKIKLNQIAFLFPSFANPYPQALEEKFSKENIRVINRKSDKFFHRKEIRFFVYVLMKIANFNRINVDFDERFMSYEQRQKNTYRKYIKSILEDDSFISSREINDFLFSLEAGQDLSAIIYKVMGLAFYKEILEGAIDELDRERIYKNTGKFVNLCVDFDEIYPKSKDSGLKFVNAFLFVYFKKNAIGEFDEDDSYEDAINFMTIHQSKGLEFDVVFVSSLNDYPRKDYPKYIDSYLASDSLEKKNLDFYRKYYTAFTRAKNLLVVLDNSRDFRIKNFALSLDDSSILASIDFKMAKKVKEKKILAYTTDIDVYLTCPLKYKFVRKLSYRQKKTPSLIFGSKVHELAQYMYSDNFDKKAMTDFLKENESFIIPISNLLNKAFEVGSSEVNYKADRNFYILQGNIDIILKDQSLMDLKTGSFNDKSLDKYKKQVITYNKLMKLNGEEVKDMYLYFIEKDELIKVCEENFDLDQIDRLAENIIEENFDKRTDDKDACKFCQMKFYCNRA